jgi:hypothetical protein
MLEASLRMDWIYALTSRDAARHLCFPDSPSLLRQHKHHAGLATIIDWGVSLGCHLCFDRLFNSFRDPSTRPSFPSKLSLAPLFSWTVLSISQSIYPLIAPQLGSDAGTWLWPPNHLLLIRYLELRFIVVVKVELVRACVERARVCRICFLMAVMARLIRVTIKPPALCRIFFLA